MECVERLSRFDRHFVDSARIIINSQPKKARRPERNVRTLSGYFRPNSISEKSRALRYLVLKRAKLRDGSDVLHALAPQIPWIGRRQVLLGLRIPCLELTPRPVVYPSWLKSARLTIKVHYSQSTFPCHTFAERLLIIPLFPTSRDRGGLGNFCRKGVRPTMRIDPLSVPLSRHFSTPHSEYYASDCRRADQPEQADAPFRRM